MDLICTVSKTTPTSLLQHTSKRCVRGISQCAVNLNSAVNYAPQTVCNKVFGHRYLARKFESVFNLVRGVQDHQLALVQLHRRVCNQPLNSLLLRQNRTVRIPIKGASNHHVEGSLRLTYPSHAMRESCWSESILAQQVTLTATAEHAACRYPQILNQNFAMVVTTRHGLNVTNNIPSFARYVNNET